MGENQVTHIVTFSCLHTRIFSEEFCPFVGEKLLCIRCNEHVTVKSAPAEYRIRCRKCKLSKRYGRAKINAEIAAVQHRKSRQDHTVDVFDGKTLVLTIGHEQTHQLPLGV